MLQKKAFSLIELLVVIAIVAILSAIAVPAYKNYAIRAKISKSMSMIQDFANATQLAFVRGNLTTSSTTFVYNGSTIPTNGSLWDAQAMFPGSFTAIALWGPGNAVVGSSNREWLISFRFAGLSDIPGYVVNNNNSEILYRIAENNGGFTIYCGRWNSSSNQNIPLQYLPSTCSCSSVETKSC